LLTNRDLAVDGKNVPKELRSAVFAGWHVNKNDWIRKGCVPTSAA
jgi:hypothetical protein